MSESNKFIAYLSVIPAIKSQTALSFFFRSIVSFFIYLVGFLLIKLNNEEIIDIPFFAFFKTDLFPEFEGGDQMCINTGVTWDWNKLKNAGVDLLFSPDAKLIYPKKPTVKIDFGSISKNLEGAFRSGHFEGVGLIVMKLFNLIKLALDS